MRPVQGIVIVALVAVSWYVLASLQGGWAFFQRQVLDENVFRFFESEHGGPSRDHAFYYYLPALFAGMIPWSLFFPLLGYFLYRSRLHEKKLLYLTGWFCSGLVFFSLASGKRANYLLPLYPAVAILLGVWWQELVEGSFRFSPLVKQLARGMALLLCAGLIVAVCLLVAHGIGIDLDHLVSPLLHPRDLNNLPIVAESLQQQFPVVFIWLLMLFLAIGWYFWGLRKGQWMYVFAALTVAASSSLYFTKALFHPLLAQERTYKPFMLGVRSTVKNAPLYFYHGAYDYGAIFYAARRIPVYKGDLADFPVDGGAGGPSYLLVWAEDWPTLVSTSDLRFEYLVCSEGRGPDKKHQLALIAVLPSLSENREQRGNSEADNEPLLPSSNDGKSKKVLSTDKEPIHDPLNDG
jgi:4-amino-4-deoxy-L-arabinose transferase-like glycosyltransferase